MSGEGPRAAGGEARTGSWTVLELLRWTTSHFAAKGIETPRLDAECLLAHCLAASRIGLYVDFEKPVTAEERGRFRELVRRRANERVPVSQLVGEKEFWSLPLKVSREVLTPRPDTETLVEVALRHLADPERSYRILDVGTGSGAIALALARERPRTRITATDVSSAALRIARLNADELHIGVDLRLLEGSLFEPVEEEQFDLIVSNPPYLARGAKDGLPPELFHEPDEALFAGEDGYEVLRPLVAQAMDRLEPGGRLAVEVDPGQASTVAGWCAAAGWIEVETVRDLARRPRVVTARRSEPEDQSNRR